MYGCNSKYFLINEYTILYIHQWKYIYTIVYHLWECNLKCEGLYNDIEWRIIEKHRIYSLLHYLSLSPMAQIWISDCIDGDQMTVERFFFYWTINWHKLWTHRPPQTWKNSFTAHTFRANSEQLMKFLWACVCVWFNWFWFSRINKKNNVLGTSIDELMCFLIIIGQMFHQFTTIIGESNILHALA